MIESLTQEQIDKLPLYNQKWLKIGLSTEPINVKQCKYWIRKLYEQAGLAVPIEWMVFDSPLACVECKDSQVWSQVRSQNLNQIYNQVYGQVCNQIEDQLYDQVRDQLYDQIRNQVYNQVYNQVRSQNLNQIGYRIYGNHAYWLAEYDFLLNELKLDCVKPLNPFIELTKYCGWWIPYKKICLLTHRPKEIHINSENILHNESGPAVLYRDNYSAWRINGVRVDEQIVMHPETQTIKQINEETNEERRSIRIERFGWNRYLKESGATIIESGPNDIDTTHEILARTPIGLRLLTLCPSTGRVYSLGIGDVGVNSCFGAQQWLWGNKSVRFVGRT